VTADRKESKREQRLLEELMAFSKKTHGRKDTLSAYQSASTFTELKTDYKTGRSYGIGLLKMAAIESSPNVRPFDFGQLQRAGATSVIKLDKVPTYRKGETFLQRINENAARRALESEFLLSLCPSLPHILTIIRSHSSQIFYLGLRTEGPDPTSSCRQPSRKLDRGEGRQLEG
jgi:hypothetical protein